MTDQTESQPMHRPWTANPSEQWSFALDHMDRGEFDLAVRHCQNAIEIYPSYYDAWLLMSGAYEEMDQLDDALSSAERASEIAVLHLSQAWNNLAALHLVREEYDEAITIDRILDLIDPTRHAIVCYRMAVAYTSLGQIDDGERFLREAIDHRADLLERAVEEPLLVPHLGWLVTIRDQQNDLR